MLIGYKNLERDCWWDTIEVIIGMEIVDGNVSGGKDLEGELMRLIAKNEEYENDVGEVRKLLM